MNPIPFQYWTSNGIYVLLTGLVVYAHAHDQNRENASFCPWYTPLHGSRVQISNVAQKEPSAFRKVSVP